MMNFPVAVISSSKREPTVAFPTTLEKEYVGPLYGKYIPNSNYYNVVVNDSNYDNTSLSKIGYVFSSNPFKDVSSIRFQADRRRASSFDLDELKKLVRNGDANTPFDVSLLTKEAQQIFEDESLSASTVVGYRDESGLVLISLSDMKECVVERYSLKLDVFSRNVGILESDIMLSKKAVLIGCGSVCSLVALELAKSGVGNFMLIDSDIMGYHNVCRHQCGMLDVGRYKTEALKDRILQINPYANVITYNDIIQHVPLDELSSFCNEDTIFIGGADNREGDLYANQLAIESHSPFMSIGCWERAYAGEIFYCLPEGMPTYTDLMATVGGVSGRVNQNRKFYTTEAELEKASFEPGISADIDFVTVIAVKIALDLLNRNNENYKPRVINHLTQFTLVCNTCSDCDPIFSHPLQITTSLVVPYANGTLPTANVEEELTLADSSTDNCDKKSEEEI